MMRTTGLFDNLDLVNRLSPSRILGVHDGSCSSLNTAVLPPPPFARKGCSFFNLDDLRRRWCPEGHQRHRETSDRKESTEKQSSFHAIPQKNTLNEPEAPAAMTAMNRREPARPVAARDRTASAVAGDDDDELPISTPTLNENRDQPRAGRGGPFHGMLANRTVYEAERKRDPCPTFRRRGP